MPGILDQSVYDEWSAAGSQTLGDRLSARVEKILADHKPPALSDAIKNRVHEILEHYAHRAA
jgi:trimethylamine:corrinoid methyltransferase-like protein